MDAPLAYARNLIRYKARRLTRRPQFSSNDRSDLEQELLLAVLERLPSYDADKAKLSTFISLIVDHAVVSVLRHRTAAMRDPAREKCSLNEPVQDGDDRVVERHQTTPEVSNHHQDKLELKLDVAEVRERFTSGQLRLVLDHFAEGGTVNSVARKLGVSRHVVNQRREELRQMFEDAELREYL